MSMEQHHFTVKVILLGDYIVNKKAIIQALNTLTPSPDVSVIGLRPTGLLEMVFVRDGKSVQTKIVETAGLERHRSITASFYRGAHGCLLLFDVTKESTFESMKEWRQELLQNDDGIVTTLVGCNCHVPSDERQVAERSAVEFANFCNIPYEEISLTSMNTLVLVLEKLIDRILLQASKMPMLSSSIKPMEQKLEDANKRSVEGWRGCSCL